MTSHATKTEPACEDCSMPGSVHDSECPSRVFEMSDAEVNAELHKHGYTDADIHAFAMRTQALVRVCVARRDLSERYAELERRARELVASAAPLETLSEPPECSAVPNDKLDAMAALLPEERKP